LGAQWRIADQEPNISFFGNSFPDVGTQDLALTTNADGTTSVGWGGETFVPTMDAAPDSLRMTLMSLDS